MDLYIENIQLSDRFNNRGIKFYEENIPSCAGTDSGGPNIRLTTGDSLAHALGPRAACVLNFANNDVPGGPYSLRGKTQEEVLLKRTSLGATLHTNMYPIDTIKDNYSHWVYEKLALIYSPSVYILRDQDYNLTCYPTTPGPISIITCAAINNPKLSGDSYLFQSDRDVTRRKIRMIIDTAIMQGHSRLIAGQWGCGAFGNPLEICQIWAEESARRPNLLIEFPIYTREFEQELLKFMT